MAQNKSLKEVLSHHKHVSMVFLGVGLCLFFLNIASMLSFLPTRYSFTAFDISVFSSMLIIIYATYNLHEK